MVLTRFGRGARSVWIGTARRLREANWYAIGAELLLIVAGILIAFQLDRWAERWRKADDRRLYVERLAEESGRNAEALAFQLEGFREDTQALRRLLVALPDAQARAAFARSDAGACELFKLPAVNLQGAAMAEHGALATAALLDDPALRVAIRDAAAGDDFIAGQLDYFRAGFQRYAARLEPFFLSRFDPATGDIACTVAADALAADRVASSVLVQLYTSRRNFGRMRERQLGDHRALHARAQCLLAGDCPES